MKKDDVVGGLIVLGIGAAIGALTGLGLSFTALSPLVMGGIVAAVPVTLFFAFVALHDMAIGEKLSKKNFFLGICCCVASTAIGVGLAAVQLLFSLVQCLEWDLQL